MYIHSDAVHAQGVENVDRPIVNPLALGGMLQGLLDMQVRLEKLYYYV